MGKIVKNGVVYSASSDNATNVKYNNNVSDLDAANVQTAIDKLSDSQNVKLDPPEGMSASNVQDGINELNSKLVLSGNCWKVTNGVNSNVTYTDFYYDINNPNWFNRAWYSGNDMGFQNWKNGSYTDIWNLSNLSRHTQVYNGNDITMAKNYTYYDLATITITDAGLYYIRGYVRDQTSSEHVTEFGIHNGATNQLYPVHTIRRHTQDFEYDAETTTVIYVNANTVFKVQARANENSIRVIGDILAVRIGA